MKLRSKTTEEWIEAGEHLPLFMRDLHDQKDVFKCVGDGGSGQYPGHITWVHGMSYVIDPFLKFMARHGYTLRRSHKQVEFENVEHAICKRHKDQMRVLKSLMKRAGSREGATREDDGDKPTMALPEDAI